MAILNVLHLPLHIDCQTPSGQIPGDELEQEIDSYGG